VDGEFVACTAQGNANQDDFMIESVASEDEESLMRTMSANSRP